MKKKLILTLIGLPLALVMIPMLAAFEAHVVNVTATIENALNVSPLAVTYGTVFPQQQLDQTFNVSLSDSFVALASSPGANLIVNGGFETPIVTDPAKWDIFPDGTPGLGWHVVWEPADAATFEGRNRPVLANAEFHNHVSTGWDPQEGNQYTELDSDWFGPNDPLNGEPALVSLSQDVTTVPGQEYLLSYWFSPRPSTDGTQNVLLVRIDGSQIDSHSAAGGSTNQWTHYTNTFTATNVTTKVEFAGGGPADSLGTFLDNVSLTAVNVSNTVDYVVRQKPKCVSDTDSNVHPQVLDNADGSFSCPAGSTEMPLLCPYLSKHEITADPTVQDPENDGPGINAFHGLPGPWNQQTSVNTQVTGELSTIVKDLSDTWNVDLKVPCFKGQCAQDWASYVHAQNPDANPDVYMADPANHGQVFGCDLWVEATKIQ